MIEFFCAIILSVVHCHNDSQQERILGGRDAEEGEFPFAVSLQHSWSWSHFCGGSLLDERFVLTACHCLVREAFINERPKVRDPSSIAAVVGTLNIFMFHEGQRQYGWQIAIHPECRQWDTGWAWDVGLLQVHQSFKIIPGNVEALALPHYRDVANVTDMTKAYALCQTYGWGTTIGRSQISPQLQEVTLSLLPQEDCQYIFDNKAKWMSRTLRFSASSQICTLGEFNKDACSGDSGGPLLCQFSTQQKKMILVALVSWGIGCGQYIPGIWARVDIAEEWIRRVKIEANAQTPRSDIHLIAFLLSTIINFCSDVYHSNRITQR